MQQFQGKIGINLLRHLQMGISRKRQKKNQEGKDTVN